MLDVKLVVSSLFLLCAPGLVLAQTPPVQPAMPCQPGAACSPAMGGDNKAMAPAAGMGQPGTMAADDKAHAGKMDPGGTRMHEMMQGKDQAAPAVAPAAPAPAAPAPMKDHM